MLVLHQLFNVLSMLWYTFYAFSGTNLLTSCHSASSLFSAVFRFRNPKKEISSESDEINYTINKRLRRSRSPEGTLGGTPRPHTIGGQLDTEHVAKIILLLKLSL